MTERPQEEQLQVGRSIVDRIRIETNAEFAHFAGEDGEDVFATLYLKERDVCVPEHLLGDDVLMDVHALFCQVFDGIREELDERHGREGFIWIAVDPSYEDSTFTVMCTDERVLLLYWSKAWNFYWQSEEEMAEELAGLYETAAAGLLAARAERKDDA